MRENFRVALSLELMSESDELVADRSVVVDLAIEDTNGLSTRSELRLVGRGDVDDRQSAGGKADSWAEPHAVFVGPPVGNGVVHPAQGPTLALRDFVGVSRPIEASQATHALGSSR